MGFSKATVLQAIEIGLTFRQQDDTEATVVHTFRRPTMKEREKYRKLSTRFEKGQLKPDFTTANAYIWNACIQSVSGYDDLPEGDFRSYFEDDLGAEHRDAAARHLLDYITETEADLGKKSEG
jgi:hypothetical protein